MCQQRPIQIHLCISIHSLLAEGDAIARIGNIIGPNFNPLPPRGGRRPRHSLHGRIIFYFNPLPPRGGRRPRPRSKPPWQAISIHSLLAEGDNPYSTSQAGATYFNPLPPRGGRRPTACLGGCKPRFQSTPSSRRETFFLASNLRSCFISIHSLLAEGDVPVSSRRSSSGYFNPLPPRGGRRFYCNISPGGNVFQSTPSSRRETPQIYFRKTS